jgi:hypothetical protein
LVIVLSIALPNWWLQPQLSNEACMPRQPGTQASQSRFAGLEERMWWALLLQMACLHAVLS